MYLNRRLHISIMVNMRKQLNINDINQQFVDSISFCLISYSGCLGPSGYIFFMNDNGDIYHCNYDDKESKEYISLHKLCEKCRSFGFDLNLERNNAIKEWDSFYLGGCGNYLYVCPKYALNFYRLAYRLSSTELFENWEFIARHILCTKMSAS